MTRDPTLPELDTAICGLLLQALATL